MRRAKSTLAIPCAALLLTGCAALTEVVRPQTPDLSIESMRITGLSFAAVDLVFDIGIDNPNALPVTLTGFDYDLQVEGASLVSGSREETTQIAAAGQSVVQLPVRLDFGDLRRAVSSLRDQDSTAYELVCEIDLDLPILGMRRLPLRHGGRLPVIRPPRLEVGDLRVRKLGLTGADLDLQLRLDNPNPFGLVLDRLDYRLDVSGTSWAHGATEERVALAGRDTRTLTLPLSLDFLRMGMGVYRAVSGREPLDYHLTGQLDLGTDLPLLPRAALPVDLAGRVQVLR